MGGVASRAKRANTVASLLASDEFSQQRGDRCRWIIVRLFERDAEIAHQSESGRDRTERQEHDRKARAYEETTGNPHHLSKNARLVISVLAVIVAVLLTGLFVSGFVRW